MFTYRAVLRLLTVSFLILDVWSLSDEMKELAQQLHNTCVEETGVKEALIDKVNKEKVFEDDEPLKCYIKCLMSQMACIDDDGIIDEEATLAVLPEEYQALAEPVIKKCGTVIGSSPCENAWLTHKCYMDNNKEVRESWYLWYVDFALHTEITTSAGPYWNNTQSTPAQPDQSIYMELEYMLI